MHSSNPVLIGQGQHVSKPREIDNPPEPIDLIAEAAKNAREDSGVEEIFREVDYIGVVDIWSWRYRNPVGRLAKKIGVNPGEKKYTELGGEAPQKLINETAEKIAEGEVELALLSGGEALAIKREAMKRGIDLSWPPIDEEPDSLAEKVEKSMKDVEMSHGLYQPTFVYPLFENALRANYGRDPEKHIEHLGGLCEEFSAKAAENPYAWFREKKSAEEIVTISSSNKMVSYPYRKFMTAMPNVNQSAALLLASEGKADELDIPENRRIYLWGCADAQELWHVTDRINYHTSPALKRAGGEALEMAGIRIDDVDYFDIYSCFPSAVEMTMDMLGIPEEDYRPSTLTGGLPYFGGPGNNYTMHSIASVVKKLRGEGSEKICLVTALGMYMTKHSIGIYSNRPKGGDKKWSRKDPKVYQEELDNMESPAFERKPKGVAEIETYTVTYDDGRPDRGIVIGRLENGSRFVANTPDDEEILREMVGREMVGMEGRVEHKKSSGRNVFSF